MLLYTALLLAQSSAPAAALLRTAEVAVVDERGAPVGGLVRDEVVVLENGVARDVAAVEPDTRPLSVTLLVDSSEPLGADYRLSVVRAAEDFLERLAPGTRVALWTTGARPTRRYGPGDDLVAAARTLKRVLPEGGSTVLDALVEAVREVSRVEGQRTAVVVLSGSSPEFSSREYRQLTEQALSLADEFHVVQFQGGGADVESQRRYGFAFDTLTRRSGGLYETPVSVMGAASGMRRIGSDLAGRYRIRYATLEEIAERRLEVQVARPGVTARVRAPEAGS